MPLLFRGKESNLKGNTEALVSAVDNSMACLKPYTVLRLDLDGKVSGFLNSAIHPALKL